MTKGEFMRELDRHLSRISENEKKDAMEYYADYFAEAGITDDMLVPGSLGTPKEVAEQIISESSGMNNNSAGEGTYYSSNVNGQRDTFSTQQAGGSGEKDNTKLILAVVLIVVFSPVWIGLLSGIGGLAIGFFAALVGLVIGFGCAAVALIIAAFMASSAAGSVLLVGIGLLFASLTLGCLGLLVMYCGQFIPWAVKEIISLVKNLLGRKEQLA